MIKVLCVGKIKENYLKEAVEDYCKRIKKYTKLEIVELVDSDINSEKKLILSQIKEKDYIIVLDIGGKQMSSTELSNKIDNLYSNGFSNIVFIIGGSDGLHEEVKDISKLSLSFSKLTFPHQLFRVLLLEQIYRSFKILKNESYHK